MGWPGTRSQAPSSLPCFPSPHITIWLTPCPPHTFVLKRHLSAISVSAGCKCRHSMRVSARVAFSPRAGTSFKLTGCWQTHCLVDENLRSPFPPLLTARDRSQLLESPYSSRPHGSMGSSHMDVYFLPSWRESLCLPLLQLVEKTVCFQRAWLGPVYRDSLPIWGSTDLGP